MRRGARAETYECTKSCTASRRRSIDWCLLACVPLELRYEAAHVAALASNLTTQARARTSAERDKREHYKRRAARLAKSPAHARRKSQTGARKDEKIFPDGQDSVNVAGLGAEEHLAAIHADQFHRLLRADSFDDFQDM